jgi:hypothetical protein
MLFIVLYNIAQSNMCRCMLSIVNIHVHMFDCATLYKTLDTIHLHIFDCAILYKTMNNIHLHMFDCYAVQDNGQHAPAHV